MNVLLTNYHPILVCYLLLRSGRYLSECQAVHVVAVDTQTHRLSVKKPTFNHMRFTSVAFVW